MNRLMNKYGIIQTEDGRAIDATITNVYLNGSVMRGTSRIDGEKVLVFAPLRASTIWSVSEVPA